MRVRIKSYNVVLETGDVSIDIMVELPTSPVSTTVVAKEATLNAAATARSATTWTEQDIVAVVSNLFRELANTVVAG